LWAAPWLPTGCWLALHAASGSVAGRSTRSLERMATPAVGFAIFIAIAIASAVAWNKLVRVVSFAVAGATVTTVVVFQLLAILISDGPEKFLIIAIVVESIYALGISIAVGIAFWLVRRRKGQQSHAP
jgi:hypothetical protein